ncbi:MAG: class I tRNA ligase family protein [Nanoarchaeota archaeon]
MKQVNFSSIDKKWQKEWEKAKVFEAKEDTKKEKYYVLEMYAYPSGQGLHMGHAFNYTLADILARFKRMNGKSILYPTGYDSFGLPAENAAIKEGVHPRKYTDSAVKNFIQQQKSLGLSYDWSRLLWSHDPKYYKWNQYFFLQFLKKDLVYRKESPVNWCSKCESVLANEQVHDGKCWRHKDTEVNIRNLEQWFIKTTKYADELLKDVDALDWPERIKAMQKNWIGKSEGTEVLFEINGEKWPIFTTRIDTLFGVTFLVISAQHSRLNELVTKEQKKHVDAFLKKVKSTKQEDMNKMEKEGVFTGSYALHPLTGKKIPIWTGNFVLADYGSGVVMAVPAHDERDFAFAKKYDLPIHEVVVPNRIDKKNPPVKGKASKERKNVQAIVRNPKTGKILFLKSFEHKWITLPMGGVEGNESVIDAAKREVKEETGYTNLKYVKTLGGQIRAEYFANHKDENRVSYTNAVMFDLVDEKKAKLAKDEEGKHEIMWLDKKDVVYPYIVHAELNDWLHRWDKEDHAYTDYGVLINSGDFNGLTSEEAIKHIQIVLKEKKLGNAVTNYKLRDWLISRQRYWGTPIPIIYCTDCGTVPVPEKDLPILLPEKVTFGKGNPLLTNDKFVKAKCPNCGKSGRRETDTMDTFMDSSWYYLRFTDTHNDKLPLSVDSISSWLPVDFYIGGAEHACMHLIYARFFTKALRDLGYLKINEPFTRLYNQGMIHAEDGFVMSKSRGNVINPLDIVKKYSADTLRLFLVSVGSPDKDFNWSPTGLESMYRFINRVWNYANSVKFSESSARIQHKVNKSIIEVTNEIKNINYNMAVIKLRALFDSFEDDIDKGDFAIFLQLLSPFAPHIAEELWHNVLGYNTFVSLSEWPTADTKRINDNIDKIEESFEKTVSDIQNVLRIVKDKERKDVKHIYLYAIPPEVKNFDKEVLTKRLGIDVSIFAVNDNKKYDPSGKASKAKPGKPAIYVE